MAGLSAEAYCEGLPYLSVSGRMAELANAYGLGPYGVILGGSTPLPPTRTDEGYISVIQTVLEYWFKSRSLTKNILYSFLVVKIAFFL